MSTLKVVTAYVDLAEFHQTRGEMSIVSGLADLLEVVAEPLMHAGAVSAALENRIIAVWFAAADWKEATQPGYRLKQTKDHHRHMARLHARRRS